MMPTLLHAVARKAEALTPDADLLARFARDREHLAFEELVRRHGPLVWAVCRQMLPHHADAEDAFQAVFLALVRSASTIRDGRTLPAWLHGVAVRVALRARREFARRRARDRAVAVPEADRPVSNAEWESLVAVVHEEVQRLPESERTAFVLCDLEGVSQPDAAARLGCPLGSVSGRLCKARQRLLERLAARGVAPAAVVGVGLTAGAASALPAQLFDAVKTFPATPAAASGVAAALARGLTEGVTMRVKLSAATAVVVLALGLTGGAVLLSKGSAQPPGPGAPPGGGGGPGGPPPGMGPGGFPGGPPGPGGFAPQPGAGAPGAPGGPRGGGEGGMGGGFAFTQTTWEYKFVDVKSDRKAFEQTITQHGKEGWEFCSSERFGAPQPLGAGAIMPDLVLVFKKRKGGDLGGFGMQGFGGGAMGNLAEWRNVVGGAMGGGGRPEKGDPGGLWGNWGGRDGVEVRSFVLKHASPADAAAALNKALAKAIKAAVPEPGSNRLLVVYDASAMKDVVKIVEDLDARSGRGPGAAGPGPMGPMGFGPGPGFGQGPSGPMGMGIGATRPASGGLTSGGQTGAGKELQVVVLKHAAADDMVPLLKKVFATAEITADARTNQLIIRADAKSLEELKALLTQLDVDVPKKR